MSMMQTLVLNQLVHNADYFGKVLPHLKKDYFDNEPSRILFAAIDGFAQEYNNQPTPDAMAIIVNDLKISEGIWEGVIDLMGEVEKPVVGQNYEWLLKETEKWMRDRAVYNVITDSVDIYSNPTRREELGEIPSRMEDALVVGFDDDLGMVYWEMAGEQYDYMHTDVNRIPFTVDIPKLGVISQEEDIQPNTVFNINVISATFEIFESSYYLEITMSDPDGKVEVREFILQDTMAGDQQSWVFIARTKSA